MTILVERLRRWQGVLWACLIISLWLLHTWYFLFWHQFGFDLISLLGIFTATHLYTGLFITAHDAMHGSLAPKHKRLNHSLGSVGAGLFAFNDFNALLSKHHLHHNHVGTEVDPDYHHGSFWPWYWSFAKGYVSLVQLALMAFTYNVLALGSREVNVILYWMLPSTLSTLQLFYFGTYLPHKGEHSPGNLHKARSQQWAHVLAFMSCYFFGYHYEHHASPGTPWWRLPQKVSGVKA